MVTYWSTVFTGMIGSCQVKVEKGMSCVLRVTIDTADSVKGIRVVALTPNLLKDKLVHRKILSEAEAGSIIKNIPASQPFTSRLLTYGLTSPVIEMNEYLAPFL